MDVALADEVHVGEVQMPHLLAGMDEVRGVEQVE
jgi:hypothetical protein